METRRCPSCDKLIGTDYNFCIHCGFQLDDDLSGKKSIRCPSCGTDNASENIGCEKCGYILRKDGFHPSNAEYKRCLRCGNISPLNDFYCSICGYDFSSLWISKSYGDFFKNHPECTRYSKNIDFFKKINEFHDYDRFLYEFRRLCDEQNIELFFDVGMVRCPECGEFLSFISKDFLKDSDCPHCGYKFNSDSNEAYCINCGRLVRENQTKCECGYEFKDINCPYCKSSNAYTNNHCTSCGKSLWDSKFKLPETKPVGGTYEDGKQVFEWEFLKREIFKKPFQINGELNKKILGDEHSRFSRMADEIISRWWIVSPWACKSCARKINPLNESCLKCSISHYTNHNRIKELKTVENNYSKNKEDAAMLADMKWSYKPSNTFLDDYLNFIAPKIGESQLEYKERLFIQWWEISLIIYLIKCEWNIYFGDTCMNCGGNFEKYNLYCPSCGMKKNVPAIVALFRDDEKGKFPLQYDEFTNSVKDICRSNCGDISHISEGIAECPKCHNYFKFLASDFFNTHRCPHCGVQFNLDNNLYQSDSLGEGRCPDCGAEMDLRYYYVNYGDMEGEEARYTCPRCGYSGFDHADYW